MGMLWTEEVAKHALAMHIQVKFHSHYVIRCNEMTVFNKRKLSSPTPQMCSYNLARHTGLKQNSNLAGFNRK